MKQEDAPPRGEPMDSRPTVVIGDGWAALGTVGFLALSGVPVRWITGTGARLIAPLPSLEAGPGVPAWQELARRLRIALEDARTGVFLREFRSRAFREPVWTKAPTPEARRDVRDETLWGPEAKLAPAFESRFESPLGELEEEVRKAVLALPGIERIEGMPVNGFREQKGRVRAVVLGSGQELECEQVFYADRWTALGGMEGLPKPLTFTRQRAPAGALQATFTHEAPVGAGLQEGFFGAVHKEAGEEVQRHVWGWFSTDGMKSVWTLLLAADESEDNHEIAKKLRRMKQTIDRMFVGTEWIPERSSANFISLVKSEQFRFEEAAVFGGGEAPQKPVTLPKLAGITFLTDGYGPSASLHQVAMSLAGMPGLRIDFSVEPRPDAQAEGVDLTRGVESGKPA